MRGTGFDLAQLRREREYVVRTFARQQNPASHIDRLPKAEQDFVLELLRENKEHLTALLTREYGNA